MSETVERSWEVDQQITQAPHSNTEIEWLLDRNKAEGTFNANVIVSGNVAIWFEVKNDLNNPKGKNLHWLWFPSPASIIRKVKPEGFRSSGSSVFFNATGSVNADVGLESRLVINQEPLEDRKELLRATKAISSGSTVEYIFNSSGVSLKELHESDED